MQQFLPIVTGARLSIHTSSPIHECAPTWSFQGNLIRTQGLITTPLPIREPKALRMRIRHPDPGNQDRMNRASTTNHANSSSFDLPRSNPRALNRSSQSRDYPTLSVFMLRLSSLIRPKSPPLYGSENGLKGATLLIPRLISFPCEK